MKNKGKSIKIKGGLAGLTLGISPVFFLKKLLK